MGAPGGYTVTPGLYRVPDLKTEEQFVDYMREVYNVEVTFTHAGDKPSAVAARALGQSRPIGVLEEEDPERFTTGTVVDPVLRAINNSDPGSAYLVSQDFKSEETDESDESDETDSTLNAPLLPVDTESDDAYNK